jgi:hypothetical protein
LNITYITTPHVDLASFPLLLNRSIFQRIGWGFDNGGVASGTNQRNVMEDKGFGLIHHISFPPPTILSDHSLPSTQSWVPRRKEMGLRLE